MILYILREFGFAADIVVYIDHGDAKLEYKSHSATYGRYAVEKQIVCEANRDYGGETGFCNFLIVSRL